MLAQLCVIRRWRGVYDICTHALRHPHLSQLSRATGTYKSQEHVAADISAHAESEIPGQLWKLSWQRYLYYRSSCHLCISSPQLPWGGSRVGRIPRSARADKELGDPCM